MTYGQQPYGGYPKGPQTQDTMLQQAGHTTIEATWRARGCSAPKS